MSWIPKSRVLVPVDLSPACLYAIETALDFVKDPSGVHALHVQMPMDLAAPAVPWGVEATTDHLLKAEESLKVFMERATRRGIQSTVKLGRPGPTIAEYAKEHNVDLIVMPSHGHSGLQRFVLGSVAEKVLRLASCPVLVLRHDPDAPAT